MSEEVYRLTEAACMQEALKDFGINVSTTMAGAIEKVFMDYMVKAGWATRSDEVSE